MPRPSRSHSWPERRSRHRLLERSAPPGSQFLLPRYAAKTSWQSQLHATSDQRAEVPLPQFPARRAHGDAQPAWPCQLRAQFLGRGGRRSARIRCAGLRQLSRRGKVRKGVSAPKASPITTARRICSIAARRRSNRSTLPMRWFSNLQGETPAIRERVVAHLIISMMRSPRLSQGGSVCRKCRRQQRPGEAAPGPPGVGCSQHFEECAWTFKGRKLGVLSS